METQEDSRILGVEGLRILKKLLAISLIILFVGFCAFAVMVLDLRQYADAAAGKQAAPVLFSVKSGESFKRMSRRLANGGIIADAPKFVWYARLKGYDKSIKAGDYELSATLTPEQILQRMVQGKVALYKLTIPEGYTMAQIAELISQTTQITSRAFMQKATDAAFAREKGVNANTFEGYLFPETYFFPKNVTPETCISTMVRRFHEVFGPEWRQRAEALNMSVHQIVTLASMIEKETGAAFERPLIASVFHNRLKRGMRLSSDPTVIYGIQNFNGNLTRKDLETWTPFNTYLIKGLPPGPIANPGRESLEAALYPAETDYLYFVSKKDRTHQFSTTLAEHNRAVRKYQLRK
jgi:UPF0755 protein